MKRVCLPIQGFLFVAAATMLPQAAYAQGVQWQTDPPAAMQQAIATGRPVLMKFTAEWCGYCRKMEQTTFSDPATAEMVHRDFVPLLIDADEHADIARQLKVSGLPAIVIVAPDMQILERITGYQTSQKLLPKLSVVTATHAGNSRVPALPAAQQKTTPSSVQPPQQDDNPFADPFPPIPLDGADDGGNAFDSDAGQQAALQPSFDGLCLTSVVDERKLIAGSDAFPAEYRGQLLYFRDAEQRSRFFQSPEKYWPVLDGSCPVTFLETGRQVPGQLQHAAVFRQRIWLFRSRELMTQFIASPADHAARIEDQQNSADSVNRSY